MKKIFLFLISAILAVGNVNAQTAKDIAKDVRKEEKNFIKQGWTTAPGALPISKQLERSFNMQLEYDENAYPKYIMAEAMSIGENYDGAKMQALELAKQSLAGQIQSNVAAMIENSVANRQLSADQAATITSSVMASKNSITTKIGRTIPVVELYRKKNNKNVEVLVRIAINSSVAIENAKQTVREDLEKKGDELHKQLDILLGF